MNKAQPATKKKVFRRILKILAWIVASIIFLFALICILIQIPAIQNFAVKKVTGYVQGKIGTPVRIDHISISFPKKIVLEGVYVEDQAKDTLLYGHELKVNISLFKLLNNTVEINEIDLNGITSHIQRSAAGRFNFDYIIDAFASKDTTPTTDSSTMQFSLKDIELDKIYIKYHDDYMGYDVAFALDHFDTNIKKFDLQNNDYRIGDINLDGLATAIRQYKPLADKINVVDSASIKPPGLLPDIAINQVKLANINFDYQSQVDSVFMNVQLGKLLVDPKTIDLNKQVIKLDELSLKNTSTVMRLGKNPAAKEVAKKVSDATDSVAKIAKEQGWTFSADKLALENNHFKYDDENSSPIKSGMDYSHMDIQKLNFDSRNLYYYSDSVSGTIKDLSFLDKSGANIKELQTDFLYSNHQAFLKDLYLETEDTKIKRSIVLSYPSIESLTNDPGALHIETDLTGSVIALKDVAYFVPSVALNPQFAKYRNAKLRADVQLHGTVADLQIGRLQLTGLQNTRININGNIKGLPDANKVYANVNIKELSSTRSDLEVLLPKNSIPDNISIPARFSLTGNVKGNQQSTEANLNLSSTYGAANLKASVSNITDSIRAKYIAGITLTKFNVGKLIKQEDQVGVVSLKTFAHGTGYTKNKMNAVLEGVVESAEVKGYNYKDLTFSGKADAGIFDVVADINDPNIDLNLTANADMRGSTPTLQAQIMVDSIFLQPLHFADENIKLHTKIIADVPNMDIDHLSGKVMISELLVNTGTKRFISDTIRVLASSTDTGNAIRLTGPFADVSLTGKYTLSGITPAVMQIIDKYYKTSTTTPVTAYQQQQIATLHATVYNSAFLRELMPSLQLSDSIAINGQVNSTNSSIVLDGKIPQLSYNGNSIANASVNVNTTDSGLVYKLDVLDFNGASMQVPAATLSGSVANNNLNYTLAVRDAMNQEKYVIAGNLLQQNGNYVLHLLDQNLKLNYNKWQIDPQNKITFGPAGVNASDFVLNYNQQSLSLNSANPDLNAPLAVRFTDFKIESITSIVKKDSLLLGGTIDGVANITNIAKSPVFDADLTVKNFNYKKDTLGDIVIKANNQTTDSYTANITLRGKGNAVDINGKYMTAGEGNLDFNVAIDKLNLATIESLTAGSLKNMSGNLHGNLQITGAAAHPKIIGDVTLQQAKLIVSQLNSLYIMDDEKIVFRDDGIHFNSFTIKDSTGNTAILTGDAFTTDYTSYRFNLDFDANNFRVLNSQKKDNPLYYGLLYVDANIRVRGDMDKPEINGSLKVNEKTDLTIVVPQTDPQVAAREGVVEFFDQDHPQLDSILLLTMDSLNHSRIRGIDLAANIQIDKNAEFNVIIDEANGDLLKVRGEGNLSGGIDASGKVTLTGTYVLQEGAYEMSINFLKRKFLIKEGSTLTWTGEPTTADVDITAIYKTNSAPIDLVEKQLVDVSPEVKNTYRQKIPFEVILNMKGELLKPVIGFDIILPEGNYNVATEIIDASRTKLEQLRQEPSELNKQVFALLLLNRFIAENPFASGSSTSVSTLAKQSVSKLLTEQLNRLAGDLVAGVDINFGIEATDDYTTGEQKSRTDLTVGVSKRLLNDRLKVSVGSNFELEGPAQNNQKTNNIAGDIQIDYNLSKDGQYMLRGYRKDQYEVALQGQVVETGLSFIISVDYDKFKEIIERTKQRREIKKEEKQAKKEEEVKAKS